MKRLYLIPARLEFPQRKSHLLIYVGLDDATFADVFMELVKEHGWLKEQRALELAALNNVWHFSRAFVRCLGSSFRDTQFEVRLELCAIVVALTRWPISEIADLFRYCSVKKLNPAFKRYHRMPPTKFRKLYMKNPISFDWSHFKWISLYPGQRRAA
jgi:AraC-like DNA-binding protein